MHRLRPRAARRVEDRVDLQVRLARRRRAHAHRLVRQRHALRTQSPAPSTPRPSAARGGAPSDHAAGVSPRLATSTLPRSWRPMEVMGSCTERGAREEVRLSLALYHAGGRRARRTTQRLVLRMMTTLMDEPARLPDQPRQGRARWRRARPRIEAANSSRAGRGYILDYRRRRTRAFSRSFLARLPPSDAASQQEWMRLGRAARRRRRRAPRPALTRTPTSRRELRARDHLRRRTETFRRAADRRRSDAARKRRRGDRSCQTRIGFSCDVDRCHTP